MSAFRLFVALFLTLKISASALAQCPNSLAVDIMPGDVAVCPGSGIMLMANATGGVPNYTFAWGPAAGLSTTTGPMTLASPTVTTTYAVTVTDDDGCTATDQVTVTVKTPPVVNISPAAPQICIGQSVNLTASGGGTYLWNTGATTAAINVTPANTTTYTVTVTGDCNLTSTAQVTVTVNQYPTPSIAGNTTICNGQSTTLTASGGGTYLWSTGATTAAINVSPTNTTTYTVTATNGGVCTATATATVTVNQLPTPSVAGNTTICAGQSTTLTASGGGTYSWSTGATTAAVNVTPANTTTYTVTVTSANGCTATASSTVTVNPLPTPNVTGNLTICAGQSTTLTASGGGTYLWSNGSNQNWITVNPASTTTYTVTVTAANGCTASTSRTVTVNPLPVPSIAGDLTICNGQSTTLTASGGGTYLWSTGATTAAINVTPAVATTYTVTVTSAAGCTASTSATVTVSNNPPTVDIMPGDVAVCPGSGIMLMAMASGGTPGYTFAWGPAAGLSATSGPMTLASPTVTTTYIVTVTDDAGCTATDQVTITVKTPPLAYISFTAQNICLGQSTTLTAYGGGTYLWNTGATTAAITVSPSTTTTYTVTVTGDCNLTSTAQVTITV
ncbi:MAG: hypothetical protein ACK4Q5_14990, partial [Saprospiraceae bacterium]